MYGADVDELRRLSAAFTNTADELDAEGGMMTRLLNNVSWLGDNATRFLSRWTGVQLPQIGLSTRFLREAAEQLAKNATEQERASGATTSGDSGSGSSGPWAGTWPLQGTQPILQGGNHTLQDPRAFLETVGSSPALTSGIDRRRGSLWDDLLVPAFNRTNDVLQLADGYVSVLGEIVEFGSMNPLRVSLFGDELAEAGLFGTAGSSALAGVSALQAGFKISTAISEGDWDLGLRSGLDAAWTVASVASPHIAAGKAALDIGGWIGDGLATLDDRTFGIGDALNDRRFENVIHENYGGSLSPSEAEELSHRYDGVGGFGQWVVDLF